jgi:hypothetical protein
MMRWPNKLWLRRPKAALRALAKMYGGKVAEPAAAEPTAPQAKR